MERFEFGMGASGLKVVVEAENVYGPGGALRKAYLATAGMVCLVVGGAAAFVAWRSLMGNNH